MKIPWIGYPGSLLQNTYGEDLEHGCLVWDVDLSSRKHTVEFVKLPNPNPFVTVDWVNSIDETFDVAACWPKGCRFRVRSMHALPNSDAVALSARMRKELCAAEVVFKSDDDASATRFALAGASSDIRSQTSLEHMLSEYYATEMPDEQTWSDMLEVLSRARTKLESDDEVDRGTVWTVKHLEFDNLYSYGEGNYLNLSDKSGIIGVVGPNKIGKSALVGSMTYALFNSSDRDVSKNAHVVNVRHKVGGAKAIVSVSGRDYEIKRTTTKVISRGALTANTALEVNAIGGENLTGEERKGTEKELQRLLGSYGDFAVTTSSVQDDVSRFLREGPTQRKSILSRFLGIDFLDKVYTFVSSELTDVRSKLKGMPSLEELDDRASSIAKSLDELRKELPVLEAKLPALDERKQELNAKKRELQSRLNDQLARVKKDKELAELESKTARMRSDLVDLDAKIESTKARLASMDSELSSLPSWEEIEERVRKANSAKLALAMASKTADEARSSLERSKKISLKLADVPCGDAFPTCVYIKDAHDERSKLVDLTAKLESALADVDALKCSVSSEEIASAERAKKERRLAEQERSRESDAITSLQDKRVRLETELRNLDRTSKRADVPAELDTALELDLGRLTRELAEAEFELTDTNRRIRSLERSIGEQESQLSSTRADIERRASMDRVAKSRELLVNAFSRKGIPNLILGRLLPTINAEMDKVLDGIVPFKIRLRAEEESNALDILLDYGDPMTVRLLELGSGMERMMGSLALRVALSNVTTLPKADFMIVDEGFSSLDEQNAVACVQLLRSLKRWFRFVLVISHVDVIKDAVDHTVTVESGPNGSRLFE